MAIEFMQPHLKRLDGFLKRTFGEDRGEFLMGSLSDPSCLGALLMIIVPICFLSILPYLPPKTDPVQERLEQIEKRLEIMEAMITSETSTKR